MIVSAYKKQYDSNAAKYKTSDGMDKNEYLSRMKRSDKFIPVITLTLYYGEKSWDGAVSLHEMLNIPEGLENFVNDYKLLLVEARKNNLTLHNLNNKDLFNLFEIILGSTIPRNEAKAKVIQYCKEHNTDKTVIMTVAGASNIHIDYNRFEKGDGNMCTLFDEIAKESELKGEAKGKAEGEAKGIIESSFDFGLSEDAILDRLQSKLNISLQKAQEYLNMFGKQMA